LFSRGPDYCIGNCFIRHGLAFGFFINITGKPKKTRQVGRENGFSSVSDARNSFASFLLAVFPVFWLGGAKDTRMVMV
jgi:hypothetical protein